MANTVMARMTGVTPQLSCSQRRSGAAAMPSLCSPCTRRHPAFRQSARVAGVKMVARSTLQTQQAVVNDCAAPANLPAWLAPTLLAAGAPLVLAAQALAEPLNGSVGAKQADAIAQTVIYILIASFSPVAGVLRVAVAMGACGCTQAKDTVQDAVQRGPPAPTPIEILLVLSPILLYGVFTVYRSKVNPRAKLSDFAFIVAGLVIVANLVSILVFKIRFF